MNSFVNQGLQGSAAIPCTLVGLALLTGLDAQAEGVSLREAEVEGESVAIDESGGGSIT